MSLLKLFKERVEARPAPGVFRPAARSAFRALGLSAAASRPEVFDAASSVRLALKLGVRKTFDGDAAGLFGPASREESDVRDAVGRLSEPAQRARERLFWFHTRAPQASAQTVAELAGAVDALLAGGGAESLHDAALLALCGAVRLDPTLRDLETWRRAFGLWRRVFECEEFWSLLVAADLKGDYEQPVTFGEVDELRSSAPRSVAEHVASLGGEAARRGKLPGAARAMNLLRGAGLPATLLQEYENELVGPAEDAVTAELDGAFALVEGLGFDARKPATRRNYCNGAWRRFEKLRPRLAEFVELAGADSYATRRVFGHAATKLTRLAGAFDAAGRRPEALHVCRRASALAPRGSEEEAAADAKLVALGAGEGLSETEGADYAARLARELSGAVAPAKKLFKDDPKGDKTLDSYAGKGDDKAGCLTTLAFYVVVAVAVFALQWCGVINTRPTRTPIESLPSLNIRPNLNYNLNLNYNYNIPPPLNLRPYTEPPPRSTRQPGGRKRRRAREELPVAPPSAVERAPVANATPRE
ncbi:MAG TPA: hypothetical protein VF588_19390 [Pyrinomonadaceae bacterium]